MFITDSCFSCSNHQPWFVLKILKVFDEMKLTICEWCVLKSVCKGTFRITIMEWFDALNRTITHRLQRLIFKTILYIIVIMDADKSIGFTHAC